MSSQEAKEVIIIPPEGGHNCVNQISWQSIQ